MREIAWLHEQGLVSNLEDYLNLPVSTLADARLVAHADAMQQDRQQARGGAS